MSTSLCGPSNALTSLHKHTSVDRSHQRDVPRTHFQPAQDLRTSQGPSAQQVEHDFASFSGQAAPGFRLQPNADLRFQQQAPGFQHPADASWAADFQQLGLHDHPSVAYAQPAAWSYGGFEQAQQSPMQQQPLQQQFGQPTMQPMMGGYMPQQPMTQFSTPTQQQLPAQHQDADWDESAFESAFEQAALQASLEMASASELAAPPVQVLHQSLSEAAQASTWQTVHEAEMENAGETAEKDGDSDALAATAGQLLDSVKLDSSEKFQQSNFLALMRKLRDHEVVVEGDNMVEKK